MGYSKEDNSLPNQNVLGTLQEDKDTMAFWVGAIVLKLLAFFANDTEVCTVAEEFFSQQELELFEKKTTLNRRQMAFALSGTPGKLGKFSGRGG